MVNRNEAPTGEQHTEETQKDVPISRRRLIQAAGVGIASAATMASQGTAEKTNERLEITATGSSAVDYSFTCTGNVELHENGSFLSAEADQENVVQNDDGTVSVTGRVEPGYGDTFKFSGDITAFQPLEGDYRLYLNGKEVSREELVVLESHELVITTPSDGSVEYSMTTTGPITKELGDHRNAAESGNDTVVQNDDGTYTITGLTGNGYGDTLTFEGEATAFEPKSGEFSLTLDGESITAYELIGEQQPFHKFEIVTPADGSVEYEFTADGEIRKDLDNGDNSAESGNDTVVQNSDGTYTATGLTGNGYGDTYEIDGDVLSFSSNDGEFALYLDDTQVTVSELTVDGSGDTTDSTSGDTTDSTDDTTDTTSGSTDGGAIGGGSNYGNIVARSDADYVVRSASGLSDALASASSGDIVFVAGDAQIDTGSSQFSIPSGVTLASNRGQDGAPGALLTTSEEPDTVIEMSGSDARLTGLRIRGPHPDSYVTYQDTLSYSNSSNDGVVVSGANCEIDNNVICGFVHAGVFVDHYGDGGQNIHHNYIYQNNAQGLGYGVSVGYGNDLNPTIEYNYFDENRHSVTATGDNYGYVCRYNHFGPTSVMHPIDIHDPGAQDSVVEGNIVESMTRTWDDNCNHSIAGFDDTNGLLVTDNWFWNDSCTFAFSLDNSDIETSANVFGENADVNCPDIIPNHPGHSDCPWT